MSKFKIKLKKKIENNIKTHKDIIYMCNDIIEVVQIIKKKLKKNGKILFCGNGGSAADAQHLAAEFIVRLRPHINRNPIPAITLAQDTSTITACGNDYSFDDIFLRSFQALASKNDVLVCISTSGNSKNILKVLNEAKKKNIYSICFLGKGGGKARKLCNKALIVGSTNTARIQECHIFIGHFILEKVEDFLINNKSI